MDNNENLNNQVNDSNKAQSDIVNQTNMVDNSAQQVVKNNQTFIENAPKKNNSGLIILLILIIVGVGGYFAYTKLIAKESTKEKNTPTPTPAVIPTSTPNNNQEDDDENDSIMIKLIDRDMSIEFNGDEVLLRSDNSKLYVNDVKKVDDYNIVGAYVTDNFILFKATAQNDVYPYALNKNLEIIEVNGNPDTPFCGIHDISIENGRVMAIKTCNDDFGDNEDVNTKVEFVYETNQVTVKEINGNMTISTNSNSKFEEYNLTQDEEKEIKLGNKVIKLKNNGEKIYYNGKEVVEATSCGTGLKTASNCTTIYITDKYILFSVEWQTTRYPTAINENGEIIEVIGNVDSPIDGIDDLRYENGRIVATKYIEDLGETFKTDVEFVYEVNKITIRAY